MMCITASRPFGSRASGTEACGNMLAALMPETS